MIETEAWQNVWYAVWVQTGKEELTRKVCDRVLADKQVYEECFLPKYEKPWKENGIWIKKQEVLFPGYLFFITEKPAELRMELKGIPEFAAVLGDDEGPISLYQEEVDFLQKHINRDRVFEVSIGEMIGKKLVVTEGPLKDLEGKVVHVDRHKRQAVLEIEFFGRTVKMKVGLEIVRKS